MEDEGASVEGAGEAVRQARGHARARAAVHEGEGQGRRAERALRRGRDGRGRPDARRRRRAPLVEGLGLEAIGVRSTASGIATDDHRRTAVPHIYAVGDCAGYWQLAHTAFREGEVAAENAMGHDAVIDIRAACRGRSTPIRRSPPLA